MGVAIQGGFTNPLLEFPYCEVFYIPYQNDECTISYQCYPRCHRPSRIITFQTTIVMIPTYPNTMNVVFRIDTYDFFLRLIFFSLIMVLADIILLSILRLHHLSITIYLPSCFLSIFFPQFSVYWNCVVRRSITIDYIISDISQ